MCGCASASRQWRFALALCAALLALPTWAHQASSAYLDLALRDGQLQGRWSIALRDVDALLPLDANGDAQITWGEVRAAWPQIAQQAQAALDIEDCPWQPSGGPELETRSDGTYAVLHIQAPACSVADAAALGSALRYRLLTGVDATHRGIAQLRAGDAAVQLVVLDPTAATDAGGAAPAATESLRALFTQGLHHIWTGYDHLLFLLCLLLPTVLRRSASGWQAVAGWREALLPIVGVVTLFTVGHSLTLGLAALGGWQLPPRLIEPAIAASIALAAIDNLRPVFGRWRRAVPLLFGLVHGFGFAGVLAELELPREQFALALLTFNLGIEAGQLVVVAAAVPLLFLLRRGAGYRRWVLQGGSLLALLLAAVWFVERVSGVALLAALPLPGWAG